MVDHGMDNIVIAEARRWIGTPYQHQASCCQAGCDCLGLVRGIWRKVYGTEPQAIPGYTARWDEVNSEEVLLKAARTHFQEVQTRRAGDVLLFRMRRDAPAKHLAIYVGDGRMIHALSGHTVCAVCLTENWCRKLVGVFRWRVLM